MSSGVFTIWQLGPRMSKRLERLSRCIEPRTSRLIPPPELPRTKAWCRRRAYAEERSLQVQKSGGCRSRREWDRRCATRDDPQRTLERFRAKHAPGLDPGVDPGSREENPSQSKINAWF